MNRTALITSALAAVAIGFGVFERVALRRAEAASQQLERDRNRLLSELGNMKQRLDIANQRVVQAELQAASLKDDLGQLFSKKAGATPTSTSIGATTGFVAGGGPRSGPFFLRSRPPVKALETTYHALYRQLKFSKEQIEQFKAVMTDATNRFEDLDHQAKQKRVSVMDRTMQPLYAEVDAELRAKLTSQFGPDAVPVIERFTETLFLRDTVSQVASELFYTDAPLTESQANQLVDILAKNMRDPNGRLNTVFADASAMKAAANSVLSPPQREVWRELIDYLAKTSFASLNRPRR